MESLEGGLHLSRCCNKTPWTRWLMNNGHSFLVVLEKEAQSQGADLCQYFPWRGVGVLGGVSDKSLIREGSTLTTEVSPRGPIAQDLHRGHGDLSTGLGGAQTRSGAQGSSIPDSRSGSILCLG